LLGRSGKEYVVQGARSTTLTDLRRGPAVLLAGFDNAWTMRLTDPLRFHLVRGQNHVSRIEDRKDASRQDWMVDFSGPYSKLTQDYAIVARFRDPTTLQMVVVAAGIGENGTIAAGEFATSGAFLEELARQAPKGWRSDNIEAVLATQVIDRKSGPPRVLAVHVW
jgi:hypothetical protein